MPERLSRPLYDLGNLAWRRSRNTMASKTNLCWSRPETLPRPLDKLWNLAWQRSRATMVSKPNLYWSVPETLSRPLQELGNLAWQRSRATMVSKTNLSWWLPEKLSRPLKKQDLPYIFKVENYGTSMYHVQHRHAQGRVYSALGSTLDPGPLRPGGLGTLDLM